MLRQILDDILDYCGWKQGVAWNRCRNRCGPCWRACRLLSAQASARGSRLHVQIDPELAPAHEVDGGGCARSCSTCSAMPSFTAQGEVRLQLEVLGPTSEDGVQPLCLSVTDTGIGIAPEQLQHLFAPLRRPVPTSSVTTAALAWA